MPCSSEHMERKGGEAESNLVCKLLIYLLTALNHPVPKHVGDGAASYYGNWHTLDEDTALLCSTIKGLSEEQMNTLVYNGRNSQARKLADWWERHQAVDAAREERG